MVPLEKVIVVVVEFTFAASVVNPVDNAFEYGSLLTIGEICAFKFLMQKEIF